ncbi:MAG: hydrogen gas-evolving membrane-bound hydrogenase subunit E [Clostridium sp.]|uniref:hydrogen gas-evolving membrane-bound hydrogenase subunit E n=1 Tax=Clostridium sp. TaxID=1506 RepID=UPI003D6D8196
MKKLLSITIAISLIIILLLGVNELPKFGQYDNPANNEVSHYYIENTTKETGAMNIVTGIILDYRAFDTFVESSVLFTASIVVLLLLKKEKNSQDTVNNETIIESIILKQVSKVIIPCIQIFGIYIIFYGHLSPGGGFAGGTIIGTSLILSRMIYGKKLTQKKIPYSKLITYLCGSIMLYGLFKGYSFITGGNHLDFPQPSLGTPGNILSGGFLLPLNILVGLIVAITIYFFFTLFDGGEI